MNNHSIPILLLTLSQGEIHGVWSDPYVYSKVTVVIYDLDSSSHQVLNPVSIARMSEEVKSALLRVVEQEEQDQSEEKLEVVSVGV